MDRPSTIFSAGAAGVIGFGALGFEKPELWHSPIFLAFFWLSMTTLGAGVGALVSSGIAHYRDKFPRLWAQVSEFVPSARLSLDGDLYAAVTITLGNYSPTPTVIQAFNVGVLDKQDREIAVEVVMPQDLNVWIFGGTHRIDFPRDLYIMNLTRFTQIAKGVPITGVLPCKFRGVKTIRDLNLSTFRVGFADAVGDHKRRPKWWYSSPVVMPMIFGDTPPFLHRPGFPFEKPDTAN